MGFTFSHPALILPVRYLPRKFYSLNGLVIGSMIPDFEYFIRLDNISTFGHTFAGVFLFDLPAAIIVLTIYHQVMRPTLIKNLPHFLKSRLAYLSTFNWLNYLKSHWFVVICSILFGTLTHIFWDSFTSGNGYFVYDNPIMESRIKLFDIEFYTYKIIKHLSSLIGIIILLFFLMELPPAKNYSLKPDKNYWILFILLMIGIFLFQLLLYGINIPLDKFIKKIVSSALCSFLALSLYYRVILKKMNTTKLP
jgi:hypothetical protein